MQNFTEIGQSADDLWPKKRFLYMAAIRHLELKKKYIWSRVCHRVPNLLLCAKAKFHQNLMTFRMAFAI